MRRRDFLAAAPLGALALAARPTPGDGATAPPQQPARRVPRFELDEVTVDDLQRAMASGQRTARSIAELYLRRMDEVDVGPSGLRAVIERNPDALADAARLDDERRAGRVRGPLHGIPVLVKDNVDTADRMRTTAGSLALADHVAARDAHVAARLREAGAVLLGKTNLSEWANFRSTHSSSGWSARGGQTRNPWALDRSPCGSSSGSGAAAAANLCAVAVGTETDGSIVCPAAANGIVGIKPTLGLVSRAGIIPIAHSQDTAGPMARTVRDAALLLGVLAGADPRDPATARARGHADYTRFLVPDGLRGARIGVARNHFGFLPAVDRLMDDAVDAMRRAGATIVDPAPVATAGQLDGPEFEVLLHEFKADLNAYLGALPPSAPVRSLAALIAFNEAHADREMPYFGQELLVRAQAKGALSSPKYTAALARGRRLARAEGIDLVMDRHRLDALVAPTGGPAWPIDLLNGDHFTGGSSTPAAVAGYPNVQVPAGYVHGLPVGISFFGRAWSEPVLLRLAHGYEQATRHRRAPQFLSTAAGM